MEHYTTIVQSEKLLELGLNPETADMTYYAVVVEDAKNKTNIKGWKVVTATKKWKIPVNTIKNNSYSSRNGHIIPCWSLGALLEVMPERISINGEPSYSLVLEKSCGSYNLTYGSYKRIVDNVTTIGLTPIEAAYSMAVWLLENGFIKKETKTFSE